MELSNETLLALKVIKEKIKKIEARLEIPPEDENGEVWFNRGYKAAITDIENDIDDITEGF